MHANHQYILEEFCEYIMKFQRKCFILKFLCITMKFFPFYSSYILSINHSCFHINKRIKLLP